MARLGLDENQKFKRLAQRLNHMCEGMGRALARGILETLWNAAYERADDYIGDSDAVECDAGWTGAPGALADLLRFIPDGKSAGFVCKADCVCRNEEGSTGTDSRTGWFIHELWTYAPSYVKEKARKAAEREAAGKTLSGIRRDAALKRWGNKSPKQNNPDLHANGGGFASKDDAKTHYGTGRDGTGREEKKPPASRVARSGGAGGEQLPLGADTTRQATRDDVPSDTHDSTHTTRTPARPAKTDRSMPPLAMRAVRAAQLVAEEAGPAFVLPDAPLSKGHAVAIEKHIRTYSDPDDWRALGARFAAETWRQQPAGPSLLASSRLPELIESARQWDQAGRPPLDGKTGAKPHRAAVASPAATPWKPPVNDGKLPAYMRGSEGGPK